MNSRLGPVVASFSISCDSGLLPFLWAQTTSPCLPISTLVLAVLRIWTIKSKSAGKFQFPALPFTKELCYVISISKHHDFVVLHRTAAAVASKMTMSSSYEFDFCFAKSRKRVQHLSSVLSCHFTYCAKYSPTYGSILACTTPTSMSFTHLRCKAPQQKLYSTWVVKEVADALGGGLNSVPCSHKSLASAVTTLPTQLLL